MKTRFDTAESTAEPNRPTLVSHARTRRRGICKSSSAVCIIGFRVATGMIALLLGSIDTGVDQIFEVAPEDLVLGVFEVMKVVFFHRKNEDAHGGDCHAEAGEDGDPGQFHRTSSIPKTTGRRATAAWLARLEMLAS